MQRDDGVISTFLLLCTELWKKRNYLKNAKNIFSIFIKFKEILYELEFVYQTLNNFLAFQKKKKRVTFWRKVVIC